MTCSMYGSDVYAKGMDMKNNRLLCGTAFAGLALLYSGAAWAQDTDSTQPTPPPIPGPTADQCAQDPSTLGCDTRDVETAGTAPTAGETAQTPESIVITGSRIARPNLDSAVPVTAVNVDELLDGSASIGDALNDLPSLRSTFSSANSQRFIGTTGLNFLDLRGLGTSRTLVLVNGRRHVTSSAGDFQVDVNTIPFELLERADVVTGGSSAVYGSDAVAGVVNFILKRDYDGYRVTGQGGVSSRGDRGAYFITGTAGRNFADGRGNVAIAAEYSRAEAVDNTQRDFQTGAFRGIRTFVQTDDTVGEPQAGDGIPDLTIQDRVRYNFLSDGGTFSGVCVNDPQDFAFQPLACLPNGQDIVYRFAPDGTLFRDDGITDDYRPTDGTFVRGGSGSTLSNADQLFPQIERYSINLLTHYDLSDAFRPYAEFKYARINAKQVGGPSFFNSFCNGLTGASGLDGSCSDTVSSQTFITYDNAFLNPAAAAQIQAVQNELLDQFGVGPDSQGFFINRNNIDFGPRTEDLKRDTYRGVIGIEGSFNDDWRYDISATYGRFESRRRSGNNLLVQNFKNAVDAVRAPGGQIVCRINADASAANDDPACVPINIFGFGAPSQAALNYVNTTSTFREKAEQFDVLAFVNGDSSQLFELPGGPLRFSLGGEYRRETSSSEADALSASGATFLNAFPPFNPPAFAVVEGFGELEFPILRNTPGAEELTLLLAGRVSDYNSGAGKTGTTYTYNVNGIYSPFSGLRIRANYSRAVRAPTPSDLFSAQTQNFAFLTDPCDSRFINNGTATRLANCRANNPIANVPPDYQQPSGNRSVLQGGNPDLEAEKSNSLTVGAIIQPTFVPGFSLTVDYYDITVNNLISSLSGNAILQNCYDAADLNNAFCELINPRQADGNFDPDAALLISTINFAKLTARGLDFDARYTKKFDNGDAVSLRGIATYVIERNDFLDVNNPGIPNRVKSELGDPTWAANFTASYRHDVFGLRYDLRFVDRQTIGAYENYFSFNGNPPQNPDFTAERFYPRRFYHDVRVDYRVNEDYTFYVGVDNVTDELPPFGLTGAGGGSGIYDNIGRFFYAGFRAQF